MSPQKKKVVAGEDIRPVVQGMSRPHAECRSWRHAWTGDNVTSVRRNVFLVELKCLRCDVKRHQEINSRTGVVLERWRHNYHDANYLLKGQGKLTDAEKGFIRLRSIGAT